MRLASTKPRCRTAGEKYSPHAGRISGESPSPWPGRSFAPISRPTGVCAAIPFPTPSPPPPKPSRTGFALSHTMAARSRSARSSCACLKKPRPQSGLAAWAVELRCRYLIRRPRLLEARFFSVGLLVQASAHVGAPCLRHRPPLLAHSALGGSATTDTSGGELSHPMGIMSACAMPF
jgi:hypothetical protein